MINRRGPGLLRTAARTAVVAGTATAVVGSVSRRQQAKDEEQAAQIAVDNSTSQLEELADLKDKGIITQEEFDTKKKQILGI